MGYRLTCEKCGCDDDTVKDISEKGLSVVLCSDCRNKKCNECGANLTKTNSVIREYINKDGENSGDSVFSYGHYENDYFESDSFNGFDSGRYDLCDDSDKCCSCGEQL